MKPPLCSSFQVCAVLERMGFVPVKTSKKGSHRTYSKIMPDGAVRIAVVVLGKREIPRWTLEGILDTAGIPVESFLRHLR